MLTSFNYYYYRLYNKCPKPQQEIDAALIAAYELQQQQRIKNELHLIRERT